MTRKQDSSAPELAAATPGGATRLPDLIGGRRRRHSASLKKPRRTSARRATVRIGEKTSTPRDQFGVAPDRKSHGERFDRVLPDRKGRDFLAWRNRESFFSVVVAQVGSAVARGLRAAARLERRWAASRQIAELDDHILRDVGLTREQLRGVTRDRSGRAR